MRPTIPYNPRARETGGERFSGRHLRPIAYQLSLAAALGFAIWYVASTAAQNLLDLGIAAGFGFLWREAGFAIGESTLLSYSASDTYLRALAVGFFNTLRVATLSIVFATLVGTAIGLARLSANWLLAKLSAGYVELLRNVPLVVQLFFWYALITETLPAPGEALSPAPGIFLSNRGLVFPVPELAALNRWFLLLTVLAIVTGIWLTHRFRHVAAPNWRTASVLAVALGSASAGLFLFTGMSGTIRIDYPVFGGFDFAGGGSLTPEFTALFLGLALYTAAFIAEIVRAGILSVERGQFEASYSLGLTQRQVMRFIVLPQALRLIVPPVTSQYLNCTKNSSLAVAIGYPDLVSVANTTINQTGQAIEGIAIIMIVYLSMSLGISSLMNAYNRRVALRGTGR